MKAYPQMSNKVAIVTGGAQGIGKGISMRLMEERYHVIVVDRDEEAGHELAGGYDKVYDIEYFAADVSNWDDVSRLLNHVARKHGMLNALINNAADADAYNQPLHKLDKKAWQQKIDVNLGSIVAFAKHFASLLKTSRGSIVNIASTRAMMSEPDTEVYTASKGGVVALTHALANSLGPEVRVNAISPGWIEVRDWQKQSNCEEPDLRPVDHSQHPVGRVGKPDDIADMVLYLISDRAGFITGQNIVIDGGMTRKMIYEG